MTRSVTPTSSSTPASGSSARRSSSPASTITEVDPQEKKVFLSRTKEEIKNAPEFDEDTYKDPTYREQVGNYYTGYNQQP